MVVDRLDLGGLGDVDEFDCSRRHDLIRSLTRPGCDGLGGDDDEDCCGEDEGLLPLLRGCEEAAAMAAMEARGMDDPFQCEMVI
jgi:hypothetical protein